MKPSPTQYNMYLICNWSSFHLENCQVYDMYIGLFDCSYKTGTCYLEAISYTVSTYILEIVL